MREELVAGAQVTFMPLLGFLLLLLLPTQA